MLIYNIDKRTFDNYDDSIDDIENEFHETFLSKESEFRCIGTYYDKDAYSFTRNGQTEYIICLDGKHSRSFIIYCPGEAHLFNCLIDLKLLNNWSNS